MCRYLAIVLSLFISFSARAQETTASMDTVRDIQQLKSVFTANQYRWLPVAPPSDDVFLQPYNIVVPVEWSRFPKAFTRQMYAHMDSSGFPLYRISIYEDPETRETVFLNSYGTEVYRLRPEKNYDPYAWQVAHFNLESRYLLDGFHRWIYDPAHISVELVLIPEIFKVDYAIAEEQTRLMESSAMSTMETLSGPPAPPVNTNIVEGGISSSTNSGQVVLTFSIPEGFGRYAEIFAKENLNTLLWQVAENRMAVTGGTQLVWTDATSSNVPVRFYLLSNADILGGADSDGDGYSDGRERYVTGTDVNTFNFFDTDFDGMHDWFEIMYFGNLDRDGSEDFDGDGLTNAEEMVLTATNVVIHSDPTLPDTDGGGIDDGFETTNTLYGLDPLNPDDDTADLDFDGLSNYEEYVRGTSLNNPDTDGDGVNDGTEVAWAGYLDTNGVSANPWVSNGWDWADDADGDGLTLAEELKYGTNPFNGLDGNQTNNVVDVAITIGEPGPFWSWAYVLQLCGERTVTESSGWWNNMSSGVHQLKKGETYLAQLTRSDPSQTTGQGNGYNPGIAFIATVEGLGILIEDSSEWPILKEHYASDDIAAMDAAFDLYRLQTEFISNTLTALVHVADADLDVDSDNNGVVDEADDAVEENLPGKIIAVGGDPADLIVSLAPAGLPSGTSVALVVGDSSKLRILDGGTELIGPTAGSNWVSTLADCALPENELNLQMEGIDPGTITIDLIYTDKNGVEVCRDHVAVTVIRIDIDKIAFNYKPASATDDALNIRENYTTPITVPEYVKGGQNKPAAYIKNQAVKILVRMTMDPPINASLKIKGVSDDENGTLGDTTGKTVIFSSGVSQEGSDDASTPGFDESEYVEFTIDGNTTNKVFKSEEAWKWVVTEVNGSAVSDMEIERSSGHQVYVVWDAPKSPWNQTNGDPNNPWANSMEFAIVTCNSINQLEYPAMVNITTVLHNRFSYPPDTAPKFIDYTMESGVLKRHFKYSAYMSASPADRKANCVDCAFALATTFKVLGLGGNSVRHEPFPGFSFHCYLMDGTFVYDCTRGHLHTRKPHADYLTEEGATGTPIPFDYDYLK